MAKTYSNIYPKIYDFESLYYAFCRANKGKEKSGQAAKEERLRFKFHLEENLIQIQNELIWHTYESGQYHHFLVHEPKVREVAALPFRDRVVHHAIVAAIEPFFESRFIHHSYACRAGKGTHAGVDATQKMMRIVKRNHGKVYALKADIRKYFASINHDVLIRLIEKRIACKETMDLIKLVLATTQSPGIPLGNLTSQLFANIYLDALDQFVKHRLRAKHYVRYMDDFVILHHDKALLKEWKEEIKCFLWHELGLVTNNKTQIFPVHHLHGRGLDFIGARIWPTHRKIRKDSAKRFRHRVKKMQRDFAAGRITLKNIRERIISWVNHASYCDSKITVASELKRAVFKTR